MTIDIDQFGSPGWFLWRLAEEQRRRTPRLHALWERYNGNPPLPEGAENARESFSRFQKKARTNYAALSTGAPIERMGLLGFRTDQAQADTGTTDPQAGAIWAENEMQIEVGDIHEYMGVMGVGYAITGPPDDDVDPEMPFITAEDPRDVITAHDKARPSRVLAGLKITHDEETDRDRAYVYLPGKGGANAQLWIAQRDSGGTMIRDGHGLRISPRGWSWVGDPQEFDGPDCPVTRYQLRHGVGDFENHVDLLDRINHMILQRMVIATMQAFRQRAVKGVPLKDPQTGQDIDYNDILTADPGAVWLLPATAELWESGQVDLTPILASVKDDVRDYAALTRTPMSYFVPDAANGSAEGASLTREGLTFKTEDWITRASAGHSRVMRLALRYAGLDTQARMVSPIWAPVERFSLAQRYDAGLKASQQGVPWRTRMISILQYTPADVERMETERLQDLLMMPAAPAPTDPAAGAGSPAPANTAPASTAPAGSTQ